MTSLPFCIFIFSNLTVLHQYPRIIVTLTTTPTKLPRLTHTLDSLISGQSLTPDRLYIVLPSQQQNENEKEESLEYPPLPVELQEEESIRILQPKDYYGPLSSILYALENEQRLEQENAKEETHQNHQDKSIATRILVFTDQDQVYAPSLIQSLVDASLMDPQSVIGLMGVKLRSHFRHLISPSFSNDKDISSSIDKFPNIVLRPGTADLSSRVYEPMDIVSSPFCFGTDILSYKTLKETLEDQSLPDYLPPEILWSALLETKNVTRRTLPYFNPELPPEESSQPIHNNSTTTTITPDWFKSQHWMRSISFLQKYMKVWKNLKFLNLDSFESEMIQAMQCEATHPQDCISQKLVCLPQHCSSEQVALLQTLIYPPDLD
jgi:hypothetical protein